MKYWMLDEKAFATSYNTYLGTRANYYTWSGIGESLNTFILAISYTVSSLLWLLSPYSHYFLWLFVCWSSIQHYIHAIRWLGAASLRSIGFFVDNGSDYLASSGWHSTTSAAPTHKVSNRHRLQFWDVVYEWMAVVIGFGFYLDLASIVGPAKAAVAAVAVADKPAAKPAEEEGSGEPSGETEF